MPPSKTAGSSRHRNSSPAATPGVKFNTKSITPAVMPSRRLFFNSSPVYSRPNMNRSGSTPISAPIRTKFSLSLGGRDRHCRRQDRPKDIKESPKTPSGSRASLGSRDQQARGQAR